MLDFFERLIPTLTAATCREIPGAVPPTLGLFIQEMKRQALMTRLPYRTLKALRRGDEEDPGSTDDL
jgi:hypothetical protein